MTLLELVRSNESDAGLRLRDKVWSTSVFEVLLADMREACEAREELLVEDLTDLGFYQKSAN